MVLVIGIVKAIFIINYGGTNMNKKGVLKTFLKTTFLIIIAVGVIYGLWHPSFSAKRSVASYSSYHSPIIRTSKYFDPRYHYRFYPNNKNYLHRKTITIQKKVPLFKHKLYGHTINLGNRLIDRQVNISARPNYQIKSARNDKMCYLHRNYPIWSAPYRPGIHYVSTTNGLAKVSQAIELRNVARSKHHIFYQIMSGGHIYGWVPQQALKHSKIYQMPFHYYSQLQPYYAPDACEVVSLKMALSVKGRNPKMSIKKFIEKTPRNHDPNKGYNHNPLRLGDHAAIFPKALAKYARRYDKHSYDFTGMNKRPLIYELEHGNPIVFEGSYQMKDIDSDHTLVLIGYSHGDLKFADPYYKRGWHNPISWVSIKKFTHLVHQKLRGARAVVIK